MAIKQLSGSSGNARDLDTPLDPEDDVDVSAALDEVEASVPGSKRGQGAKGGAFVHA
jgi:small subunit ribosomal protein S23